MHDVGRMLMESNLLHQLEHNAFASTDEPLCLYADPAYPLRVHLQAQGCIEEPAAGELRRLVCQVSPATFIASRV